MKLLSMPDLVWLAEEFGQSIPETWEDYDFAMCFIYGSNWEEDCCGK